MPLANSPITELRMLSLERDRILASLSPECNFSESAEVNSLLVSQTILLKSTMLWPHLQTLFKFSSSQAGKHQSGSGLNQKASKPLYYAFSTSENYKHTQLFFTEGISERCFPVDTGAQVSVTPASKLDKETGPRGPALQAANGSTIKTYGTRVI